MKSKWGKEAQFGWVADDGGKERKGMQAQHLILSVKLDVFGHLLVLQQRLVCGQNEKAFLGLKEMLEVGVVKPG